MQMGSNILEKLWASCLIVHNALALAFRSVVERCLENVVVSRSVQGLLG